MLLGWIILGAIVGGIAAQARGFSRGAGIFGGALLGLFSPLLFLAHGKRRACPHCAEQIQPAATVCRFCGRDVTPHPSTVQDNAIQGMSETQQRQAVALVAAVVGFALIMVLIRMWQG